MCDLNVLNTNILYDDNNDIESEILSESIKANIKHKTVSQNNVRCDCGDTKNEVLELRIQDTSLKTTINFNDIETMFIT